MNTALMIGAVRVWRRNFLVFRRNWKTTAVAAFFEPVLWLLAMGLWLGSMMAPLPGGVTYFHFLTPGWMVATTMWGAAYECSFGSYTRMSTQRLYDAVVATPIQLEDVIVAEILWGAFRGSLQAFAVLLVGGLAGGFVSIPMAVAAFPICMLMGAFWAAATLCFVAWANNYEFFNYWLVVVLTPISLLANAYFPLSTLPEKAHFMQTVSYFLPLTHGVDPARALVLGNFGWIHAGQLALLFALTLATSFFAIRLLKRRLVK